MNEVIANRANQILGFALNDPKKPVSPNDHVNMAQSTNDTIPTAIRLGCLWRLDALLGAVDRLAAALEAKAAEFDDIVKSGLHAPARCRAGAAGPGVGGYAGQAVRNDRERIATAASTGCAGWALAARPPAPR